MRNVVFLILVDQIPNEFQVIKLIFVEVFPSRKRINNDCRSLAFSFIANLPGKIHPAKLFISYRRLSERRFHFCYWDKMMESTTTCLALYLKCE